MENIPLLNSKIYIYNIISVLNNRSKLIYQNISSPIKWKQIMKWLS